MIPLYNTDGTAQSPLGFPMSQNRLAIPVWSYAMEIYPPARIIELGTNNGGFTTALAVHAWNIKARFVTYDLCEPNQKHSPLAKFLGVEFRVTDIWKAQAEIATNIALPGVTFMLCDGGNKALELEVFAKYLKPGDVIAAHDFWVPEPAGDASYWPWREITLEQGEAVARTYGLERWMPEYFEMAGWLVYRKP